MLDDLPGDIGTKLLFENDRVRVWEVLLQPGESVPTHEHRHDYVQVMISGDKIAGDIDPRSAGRWAGEGRVEADIAPGMVLWAEAGSAHNTINVGPTTFHQVLVELKS